MFMSTFGYLQRLYEMAECGHGSYAPPLIYCLLVIYNQVSNMINTQLLYFNVYAVMEGTMHHACLIQMHLLHSFSSWFAEYRHRTMESWLQLLFRSGHIGPFLNSFLEKQSSLSLSSFLFLILFFKTRFLSVQLWDLALALQTRLALNSQRSTCLCLLSARIKGVRHHRPGKFVLHCYKYCTKSDDLSSPESRREEQTPANCPLSQKHHGICTVSFFKLPLMSERTTGKAAHTTQSTTVHCSPVAVELNLIGDTRNFQGPEGLA